MPRHRSRTTAYLELRPQDYRILEAAAVTTLRRMGLTGQWPVEDLITVGWLEVFWYCKSYEEFVRFGWLRCIDHAYWHISRQRNLRRRELGAERRLAATSELCSREPAPADLAEAHDLFEGMDAYGRYVVRQRLEHGLSMREIGARCGVTGQACRIKYQRTLQKTSARADQEASPKGGDAHAVTMKRQMKTVGPGGECAVVKPNRPAGPVFDFKREI